MGERIWIFGVGLSILLGPLCGAAWAKPADLPAPSQPECVGGKDDPEHGTLSITLDILTGRIFGRDQAQGRATAGDRRGKPDVPAGAIGAVAHAGGQRADPAPGDRPGKDGRPTVP